MSKDKKLSSQDKAILQLKAWAVVVSPEEYLQGQPDEDINEFKKQAESNHKDVQKAVYKTMKKGAEAELNGKELNQDEDHGLHVFKKIKFGGKVVVELLHKLITPFIPIFTAMAVKKVTDEITNHSGIPEEHKDDLVEASGQVIEGIGEVAANLDFDGDNAGDNLSASVLGDDPAEEGTAG